MINALKNLIQESRRDLRACGIESGGVIFVIVNALRVPGTRLLFFHRLQQCFARRNLLSRAVSSFLWNLNYILSGCNVGKLAVIEGGVVIPHPVGIVIGQGCIVAAGCWIYQNVTIGASQRGGILAYPILKKDCHIYPGACVFGGIVLAPATIVGANSVLTMSTEAGGSYVGAPARLLKNESDGPAQLAG